MEDEEEDVLSSAYNEIHPRTNQVHDCLGIHVDLDPCIRNITRHPQKGREENKKYV